MSQMLKEKGAKEQGHLHKVARFYCSQRQSAIRTQVNSPGQEQSDAIGKVYLREL